MEFIINFWLIIRKLGINIETFFNKERRVGTILERQNRLFDRFETAGGAQEALFEAVLDALLMEEVTTVIQTYNLVAATEVVETYAAFC